MCVDHHIIDVVIQGIASKERSKAVSADIHQQGGRTFRRSGKFAYILIAVVLVYMLLYMPTRYVIFLPGTAEEIQPMIHVESGDLTERGALLLTTVSMSYANALKYVLARFNPNAEIFKKKDIFRNGETVNEYANRQEFVMKNSQSNAIQAVYKRLNIPFRMQGEGVIVLQTLAGMPAQEKLQAGDELLRLNQEQIRSSNDVFKFIQNKQIGDRVEVTYKRAGEVGEVVISLGDLSKQDTPGQAAEKELEARPGLGIVPADVLDVIPEDVNKTVKVVAGEIGGPSAGLMFSLEIYNQLTQGDLTKGYRIAGTGEIDAEGNVSVIGGIQHKIVAADREKVEIFFAPADYHDPNGKYPPINNYSDAVAQAKKIKTKMQVIPVKTLDDALDYLQTLEPKRF